MTHEVIESPPVSVPRSPELLSLERTAEGLKSLQALGLQITSWNQLGRKHSFELPCRPGAAIFLRDVSLGACTFIGPQSELRSTQVGRFCSIAANVAIAPAEHPVDWVSSHPVGYAGANYFDGHPTWDSMTAHPQRFVGNSKATKVGNDVWIGRNAVLRQGVTVGDGAIIAANSFVNKDVPPYAIVGGTPAKIIRFRHPPEISQRLLATSWWNWTLDTKKHGLNFEQPSTFLTQLEKLIAENSLQPLRPPVLTLDLSVPSRISATYQK